MGPQNRSPKLQAARCPGPGLLPEGTPGHAGERGDLQFAPTTAKHLGKVGKSPLPDWASGLLLSPQGLGPASGDRAKTRSLRSGTTVGESGCLCLGGRRNLYLCTHKCTHIHVMTHIHTQKTHMYTQSCDSTHTKNHAHACIFMWLHMKICVHMCIYVHPCDYTV